MVVLTLVSSVAQAHKDDDDAGAWWHDADLGRGASNDASNPDDIQFGAYDGYLTWWDRDWYRVNAANASASGARCTQLDATADLTGAAYLSIRHAAGTANVSGRFNEAQGLRMAVATPTRTDVTFGFESTLYNLTNNGEYEFNISSKSRDVTVGDAATGADASAVPSSAIPVVPGCIQGALKASQLDLRDVYALQARAGDEAILSFADGSDLQLDFVTASGTNLATLHSGDLVRVSIPADGTYYLTASTVGVADAGYLIGVIVGPPEPPCGQTC